MEKIKYNIPPEKLHMQNNGIPCIMETILLVCIESSNKFFCNVSMRLQKRMYSRKLGQ